MLLSRRPRGTFSSLKMDPIAFISLPVWPIPTDRGAGKIFKYAGDGTQSVFVRSTWDYVADPDAFLGVLAEIERAGTPLFNALDLVRWNIRKTYLRDLTERAVPVVPTIWRERLVPGELPALIEEVGTEEVV